MTSMAPIDAMDLMAVMAPIEVLEPMEFRRPTDPVEPMERTEPMGPMESMAPMIFIAAFSVVPVVYAHPPWIVVSPMGDMVCVVCAVVLLASDVSHPCCSK